MYIPCKSECSHSLTQISRWEALNGHEQIADQCAGETGTQRWLSGKFDTSGLSCPFSTQVCFLIWFGLSSLSHSKAPLVFFLPLARTCSLHFCSHQYPFAVGLRTCTMCIYTTLHCVCAFRMQRFFLAVGNVIKFLVMYRPGLHFLITSAILFVSGCCFRSRYVW